MRHSLIILLIVPLLVLLFVSSHPVGAATYQVQVTLSYRVVNGGGPSQPPVLNYFSMGRNTTVPLTTTPTAYYIDNGTIWNVSRELQGSNDSFRWEINGSWAGGAVRQSLVLFYYRQCRVSFGISLIDGKTGINFPTVSFTYLGKPFQVVAPSSAWVDYLSPYAYGNASSWFPNTRWYSTGAEGVVNKSFSVYPKYIQQYLIHFSLSTVGPDKLASVPLTAVGSWPGWLNLTASGSSYWLDSGSSFSVPNIINSSSGTHRWELHFESAATAESPINVTLSYYEQFPFSLSFALSSGLAPSAPVLNAVSNGREIFLEYFPGTPASWVDADSNYSISKLLVGSTSNERWMAAGNTTGIMSGPATISLIYYHQVQVSFDYSVVGGGVLPSSDASFTYFGVARFIPLGTVESTVWADCSANFTVQDTFPGASPAERWELGSAPSLFIWKPATLSLVYYHQYQFSISYEVTNGSESPRPTLTATSVGNPINTTIPSGSKFWLDAGSQWRVSQFLLSSLPGERWAASGVTSGTVGPEMEHTIVYSLELYIRISSNPQAGGKVSQTSWVAEGSTLNISASPNAGWTFTKWVGNGTNSYSGSGENHALVVSSPLQETAEFYTALTIRAYGRGSVVVLYNQSTYAVGSNPLTLYVQPGDHITLLAKPAFLATFVGWHGSLNGKDSSATIGITAPAQIGASFAPNLAETYGLIAVALGSLICILGYMFWSGRISFKWHQGTKR